MEGTVVTLVVRHMAGDKRFAKELVLANGKKAAIVREEAEMKELKRLTGEVRLAWIARCYVEALRRGSRRQNADVARQLHLSEPQVRDSVLWARRKGLLSKTEKQGLPGGELTPRAIELLKSLERVQANPR